MLDNSYVFGASWAVTLAESVWHLSWTWKSGVEYVVP